MISDFRSHLKKQGWDKSWIQDIKKDRINIQSDEAARDELSIHEKNMKSLQSLFDSIDYNIKRLNNDVQGQLSVFIFSSP